MSDELEEYKGSQAEISEIIYSEKTKKIIKLDDITDAFKVIYENIPVYHVGADLPEKNRLFEEFLRFDEIEQKESQKKNNSKQVDDLAL